MKSKTLKIIALILIAAIIIGGIIAVYIWENSGPEYPSVIDYESDYIEYDGVEYKLRKNVETVLVMGLDKFEENIENDSYNNDQQSDFLMLLVIDHENKTCSAIHINRDTMAKINVLGIGGKKVGTVTQQIALAHTYGEGGAESARNVAKAVSMLLCGIPISHYAAITMDAVALLNDAVGGVAVTVLDDMTKFDSALVEGETVTLMGEQALYYVRHRYGLDDSTNASRMERQRQYLNALYLKLTEKLKSDEDFSMSTLVDMSEFITASDMSIASMDKLIDSIEEYDVSDIHTYTGTTRVTEHIEFYANEDSIKELVTKLMYKPK